MKLWQLVLGVAVVGGVGAVVFLSTRSASAASAGKKAFRVDVGCTRVETLDVDAAKSAVQSAALAEFRGQDEPAIDFLQRAVALLIGCAPTDETMFVGLPGSAGGISWGSIKAQIGSRTVRELATLAGGMQMAPGKQGAGKNDIEMLARWLMPAGWFDALQRLATVVPIPVPASKYPAAQAPASGWSRMYEWGQGLYVVRQTSDGYTVTVYNLAYPERLDLWDVGKTSYRGSAESDALFLAFLEWNGDTGSMS